MSLWKASTPSQAVTSATLTGANVSTPVTSTGKILRRVWS